ncbi:phosphomannomutase/phosphoglucomutase [uncultured Marinobacter sp.]|uniref:phosphomannomutase/phosphoglucomutase n=1 Tax=uncultured Marinobacter sp. TaxID=187379 RepID=UPI0030D98738
MKFGKKKPVDEVGAKPQPSNKKKASRKGQALVDDRPGKGLKKLGSVAGAQALLVVVVGVAVSALLYLLVLVPSESAREQAQADLGATQATARIEQRLSWIQALVTGLGSQASVRQAFAEGSGRQPLAEDLAQLLPDIEQVFVFPYGTIPRRADEDLGLGFATLDLARRAESGRDIAPDAFPRNGQWLIQAATRVRNPVSQAVEGTVVVIFRGDSLASAMTNTGGRATLVQQVSGQAREVLGVGQGDGPLVERRVSVADWSLRYQPASSAPLLNPFMVLALVMAGFLVAAIAVWLLLSTAASGLRKDMLLLVQWAQKVFAGEKSVMPELRWELPAVAGDVLQRLARAVDKRTEKNASATRPAPASGQAGDEPLFQDRDMPDIDMLDGDDDVLGFGHSATSPEVEEVLLPQVEVAPGIFRAYDIRGIVDETLTGEVVSLIGQAIGSEALDRGQDTLCIGFDGRHSSPELADALARGVISTGCNVIRVGAVPTPVLYFATYHLGTGSGVMVTGSHNPSNYNGLKTVLDGEALSGEAIQKLLQRIQTGDFRQGQGALSDQDIRRDYLDRILGDIAVAAPLRVVVDAGNGIAGELGPLLIEELGCDVIPLYCEVDGDFPNHHPDPGKPENLQDLIDRVVAEKADLGIAFDGDGDRIGVVTNEGKIIWPDRLLMLFAKDVVARNPGTDVLYDVKCSRRLANVISSAGGRPVMWKTGHSLMKAKMKETGALLAGEMSGHIFFAERWYGFDDGLYSAARLLEILGIEDRQSDEVFAEFPEDFSTPELNLEATDESKFKIIERLAQRAGFGEANISTIDGIRVDYPDGWGLCRASNTTPALVLRFEAETEPALERIKAIFRGQLKALAPEVTITF